jgi:TonB-dependent SusC/RagA subfamily outer membrane receptor
LRIAERRRDLVVVVDASLSMTGERLETAKTVARRILSQLKRGDRFRVIAFADSVRASQTAFSDASDRNIRRAERFIAGLVADGNSNISAALEHALGSFSAAGGEDRAENVILLTDGAPTAGEVNAPLILTRVKEIAGRARILAFGIGAGIDAGLLTALARETGGWSYNSVEYRTFAQRAESLIRNASSPMIADLSIAAEGVVLESFQPGFPRDVFAGQTIQLLARYRGAGRSVITISGRGAEGPVRWSDTVDFPALSPANDALARIWATDRVGDLSSYRPGSCGGGIDARQIGELGERYSVPTEFNSYLVLEPGVQVDARGNVLNAEQFRNGGGTGGSGGGSGGGGAGARGGAAAPGAVAARRLGPVIQPAAGDAVIQIRNPLSITGYTAPMIIVDGVIQMQDDPTLGGVAGNPPLPGLRPEEIRSIEVIRGAAAAALYGQRAANGVIDITTVRAVGRETWQTLSRSCAADPWSEPLLSMTLSTWQREAMSRQVAALQRFLAGWRGTAAAERTILEVDPDLRRLVGEIITSRR